MATLALRQYFPRDTIPSGKQGCGAITDIVMVHTFHSAQCQRQHGLGSLQCLDLRLLVHTEHDGVIRWIQVEPYDVLYLIYKVGIVGDLEVAVVVGLQVKQLKPPVDSGLGDASVTGPGTDTPMGAIGWWTLPCRVDTRYGAGRAGQSLVELTQRS